MLCYGENLNVLGIYEEYIYWSELAADLQFDVDLDDVVADEPDNIGSYLPLYVWNGEVYRVVLEAPEEEVYEEEEYEDDDYYDDYDYYGNDDEPVPIDYVEDPYAECRDVFDKEDFGDQDIYEELFEDD